jgi:hypothetical protein
MELVMAEFTKQKRQDIVEEFSRRHNGVYNPVVFLDEVKSKGKDHPAYDWFEWNTKKAAQEYHLWQARSFAKDLRINFTVEEVGPTGAVTVRTTEMPMVLSPSNGRKSGGGYVLTDPNDPAHMAEHCHQAAAALRSWLNRYQAALIHAGYGVKVIESVADTMEGIQSPDRMQAAE